MDLEKLEILSKKPPLYEKGDSVMWTDEYISKQLLELHLNPEVDLASRTGQSIDQTIEFILKSCNRTGLNILDLGCGPGLYTEKLAASGHIVTGVDFSRTSVEYAAKQARIKNLNIEYICKDYLDIDFIDKIDLVIMIYTDFGVLIPPERKKLLSNIYKALKPNGTFIFDVINQKNSEQKFRENRNWIYETNGFWKNSPYLELTSGYHYPDEKVFLQQHVIIDQTENIKTYRFWTHYFNHADIVNILTNNGFKDIEGFDDVLPGTNMWNGDNITFYKTVNGK